MARLKKLQKNVSVRKKADVAPAETAYVAVLGVPLLTLSAQRRKLVPFGMDPFGLNYRKVICGSHDFIIYMLEISPL